MAIDQTRHEQSAKPPDLGPGGGRDLPGIADPRDEAVVDLDGARGQHGVSAVDREDCVGLEPHGHGAPTYNPSERSGGTRLASPPPFPATSTVPSGSRPTTPDTDAAVLNHGNGRKTAARQEPGSDRRSRTE